MDEVEVRCGGCATRWPGRKPRLLATIGAHGVLVPGPRLGSHAARAVGVARGGMWWRKAAMDGAVALLRCPRCKTLMRYSVDNQTSTAKVI